MWLLSKDEPDGRKGFGSEVTFDFRCGWEEGGGKKGAINRISETIDLPRPIAVKLNRGYELLDFRKLLRRSKFQVRNHQLQPIRRRSC